MNKFNLWEWEKKFDAFENKYRLAGLHIFKAVMIGTVLGLVLVYFGVSLGAAQSLPIPDVEVGSTWIHWTWGFDNATVYIDGSLVTLDNDIGYCLFAGLDSSSKHRVDVYDNDNLMQHYTSESTTLWGMSTVFVIVGFVILCICLGLKMSLFPVIGFVLASGLLIYLIENDFEGWLILFVAFLWISCLLYGSARLSRDFGTYWRNLKRK
jgi:hypothetical protein